MTDDLDTLRPEIREAVEYLDAGGTAWIAKGSWVCIRAELLRLARENDEWQTRCLQFQTERDKAQVELAEARETIKRLNRRVQVAEAGVAEKVMRSSGRSFGRSLANAAADMSRRERDEARAELAALKARIADAPRVYHSSFEYTLDASTLYARAVGIPGEETYALVKVEE